MSPHPRSNPVALLTLLFWLPALEAEEPAAAATDARPNLYVTRLEAALPDRAENDAPAGPAGAVLSNQRLERAVRLDELIVRTHR